MEHVCPRTGVNARLQIVAVQGAQMPLAFKRIVRGLVKMPLAAYVRRVDPTHNILYVNRVFTKLLGYEPEEIVGYPACCVFSDDAKEELCGIVGAAEDGANLDEITQANATRFVGSFADHLGWCNVGARVLFVKTRFLGEFERGIGDRQLAGALVARGLHLWA